MTGERSSAAENRIARWAAIATGIWRFGITYFLSFDHDGHGHYSDLAQKNIDTGMGLERLAVVCQDVDSLFDVDTVMNITNRVTALTGAAYGQSHRTDVSLRVITDHIRAATFMIADGVLPSNEGRGYVLRRLLRRAARHGRLLGVQNPLPVPGGGDGGS